MDSTRPSALPLLFCTTKGFSERGLLAIVNCDTSVPEWLPLVTGVELAIGGVGAPFPVSLGGEVAGLGELGVLFAVEDVSWARPLKEMKRRCYAHTQRTTSKTKHVRPWGKTIAAAAYAVRPVWPWHKYL